MSRLSDEELAEKYASILLNDCGVSWETRLTVTTQPLFERAIAESRKGMWTDEDMDEYYDFVQLRWDGKGAPLTAFKEYRKERKGE